MQLLSLSTLQMIKVLNVFHKYRLVSSIAFSAPYNKKYLTRYVENVTLQATHVDTATPSPQRFFINIVLCQVLHSLLHTIKSILHVT